MPKINIVKFREDVKKAKNDLHVTQKQLAREAGVGHALISKLFNKRLKYPTRKSVAGLCSALGLDAADYYVDPMPEPKREDVAKAYVEAKATLARANSMLDDAQTRLDELKAKAAEDLPEEVAADQSEARLVALEEAHARIKELEEEITHLKQHSPDAELKSELRTVTAERDTAEQKFIHTQNELNDLKRVLEIKNKALSDASHRTDELTAKLRDDDKLILHLFEFLSRLKDGDVER